jgi:hypothetical protein
LRIFGHKTVDWKNMHSSLNIRVIKLRLRWTEMRNAYKVSHIKPEERRPLGENGKILWI